MNKALADGLAEAERRHLASLTASWQQTFLELAGKASERFALTAAADWQLPPEGAIVTLAQLEALARRLNVELGPEWAQIIVEIAQEPLAQIGISWDVKHPLVQGLLDKAARRTGRQLGEAAQKPLRDVLAKAYAEGLPVRDTASLIKATLTDAAPWQADMLARTDLNSLANGASKAAAKLAGASFKTWLTAGDDRVRPSHQDADSQTVPIDQPFVVGGEDADYPADPNLSDAEACNCRCTLTYSESLGASAEMSLSEGGTTMAKMSSKSHARQTKVRRAASKRTALAAGSTASARAPKLAAMPRGMDTLPAGVKACSMGGTPGYTGGGACHMHDGSEPGMRSAVGKAQADARKRNAQAVTASARPVGFNGTAAIEGVISDDNSIAPRVLLPDSLSWPEMPVSFLAQTVTAEGHDGAEVAGRVDSFARKRSTGKMRAIEFAGELTTPFGVNEIAPMIEDKTMRYVSADLGASEWALVDRKTLAAVPQEQFDLAAAQDGAYALGLTSGKVKAVTLVTSQALEGAMVALTAAADTHGIAIEDLGGGRCRIVAPLGAISRHSGALVAAAAPARPPRAWFETPEPPGKMPLTVTEEGRVYGHLATWDACHTGFLPSCVAPPRSPSNYERFHVAALDTADGAEVMVGKLMFSPGGGHADRGLSAAKASAYYDRTGMAAAYLRASDGEHGIWVCGSLNPDVSDEQRAQFRRELRLNPPSGDWRPFSEGYDLICGLAVAVPGFPVARTTVTIVASAEAVEVEDAIIASSGWFKPDQAAVDELEASGALVSAEEQDTERQLRVLAARAQGLDALAALASPGSLREAAPRRPAERAAPPPAAAPIVAVVEEGEPDDLDDRVAAALGTLAHVTDMASRVQAAEERAAEMAGLVEAAREEHRQETLEQKRETLAAIESMTAQIAAGGQISEAMLAAVGQLAERKPRQVTIVRDEQGRHSSYEVA